MPVNQRHHRKRIGFSATAPALVDGSGSTNTVTTAQATATVTGGVGPFSYLWEAVSNPGGMTIVSATQQSTAFRRSGMASGDFYSGTFRCKVTDNGNAGAITYTNDVVANVERT